MTLNKFIMFFLGSFVLINSINSQDFYDINTINTIEITFAESNWDYLLDQLYGEGDEERLIGTIAINGEVFDSVGVRYKGNSSYTANQVKNPLNIKLDHIIDDQSIEGYGTIKLANAFKDPSFIREVLSYEIARKYFPASLSNFANVYINDCIPAIRVLINFSCELILGSMKIPELKAKSLLVDLLQEEFGSTLEMIQAIIMVYMI